MAPDSNSYYRPVQAINLTQELNEHFSPEQQVLDASFRRYTEEKTADSFAAWLWIQNTWED